MKRLFILIFLLILPSVAFASLHPIPPVVGNVDASTIADEIITTSFDGSLYAWKADRTLLSGNWPVKFDGFVCARPALADLDNNPKDLEILVPVCDYSGKYKLYALKGSGNIIHGWIKDLDFPVYSGPAVGQFKIGAKKSKIVFIGSGSGLIYAFDVLKWGPVPGWPKDLGEGKSVSAAVYDIDGDKEDEVITTSAGGRITIVDRSPGEWKVISDINIQTGIAAPAAVADIDRDGLNELIVGATNGTLYVWKYSVGKLESAWSLPIGASIVATPIVGNLDADKELEIICFTEDGKLNVINGAGSVIKNKLFGDEGDRAPGSKGVLFPGMIGNAIFFSQQGSRISNVYHQNPELSITEWGMYHHLRQPYVVDLSASPDPFSPNGDGRKDSTTVSFDIDSPGPCKGYLNIYDCDAALVKTLRTGEVNGSGQTIWDGKGESYYNGGHFVSSETCSLLLQLESDTSDKISQLNTVTVDNTKPSFEVFGVTPETVTRNLNSVFKFYPSEPSQFTLTFFDAKGKTFKTHSQSLDIDESTEEAFEFAWDGSGDHNEIFSGKYTYIAILEDAAGNISDPRAGVINVAIDAPFVNGVYARPEIFSTKSSINKTAIHYAIQKDAKVSISIYDSEGRFVKSLLDEGMKPSGASSVDWDGANNSGTFESDGNYTIKVEAFDPNGNGSATAENTVAIDSTPPSILQSSVVPSEFSSRAMGASSALSFFLSEKADLMIEVIDPGEAVVKEVASEKMVPAGSYSFVWDGANNKGELVSDGDYKFRIAAVDIAANESVVKESVVVNSTPPTISAAAANPSMFTPASGRSNAWTKIRYTLSGGIGEVKIDVNILNASRGTVKRVINQETTVPGNYSEAWWGEVDSKGGLGDENGDGYADGGEYIFEIIATDSQGNQARAEGPVSIAQNPNAYAYIEPTIFSPARGQHTTIYYNIDYSDLLSGNAQVWINIYNQSGAKVYAFTDSVFRGNYTLAWAGTNNQTGGSVPDGTYQVKVIVEDPLGNNVIAYSNNVIVDSSGPSIKINGATPNPFVPNMLEVAYFDFTVTDPSSAYALSPIKIYNSSGSLVKTLSSGRIVWDGRVDGSAGDMNGDGLADEGKYAFVINATDEAGNAVSARGQVLVNRAVLSLSRPSGTSATGYFSPIVVPDLPVNFTVGKSIVGPTLGASKIRMASASGIIGLVSAEVRTIDDIRVRTLLPGAGDDGTRSAGTYQISWDGKNDGGGQVEDGRYKVVINALDLFGNPAAVALSYDVVVDTAPPTGMILINLGKRATNNRNVSLSLQATDLLSGVVSMKISNDGLFDLCPEESFVATKPWVLLSGNDGHRKVYVRFEDEAGNWSVAEVSDSIIFDTLPPEITSVHSDPQYISPAASIGIKDAASIYYSVNETSEVCVRVSVGNTVLGGQMFQPGQNSVIWSPGSSVSECAYSYVIVATDEAGNASQTTGADNMIVDNTLPAAGISYPSTEAWRRASFNIVGSVYDKNPVAYRIESSPHSEDAWTLIGNVKQGNATDEALQNWDTSLVDDDSYDVRLVAEDAAGNSSTAQVLYHIDNTPPDITNIRIVPKKIIPDGDGKIDYASVYFGLSETATVTARIEDKGDNLIKNLTTTGTMAVWNGTNTLNNVVRKGKYRAFLTAEDLAGNSRTVVAGTIEVKGKDEVITVVNGQLKIFGESWNRVIGGDFVRPALGAEDINDDDIDEAVYISGFTGRLLAAGPRSEKELCSDMGAGWDEYREIGFGLYNNNDVNKDVFTRGRVFGQDVSDGKIWARTISDELLKECIGVGDFNGDGKDEMAFVSGLVETKLKVVGDNYNNELESDAGWKIWPIIGNCFDIKFGDFDGDGRDEVITAGPSGDTLKIKVYWEDHSRVISDGPIRRSIGVGDFNNDGKDEVAYVKDSLFGACPLMIAGDDGKGGFWEKQLAPESGWGLGNWYSINFGDFNGDGSEEVITYCSDGSNKGVKVFGEGWTKLISDNESVFSRIGVGDFNGDGKDDAAFVQGSGMFPSSTTLIVAGDGWRKNLESDLGWHYSYDIKLADFTGLSGANPTMMSLKKQPIIILANPSGTPECISPANSVVVQTLRPTFKWYGLKNVRDYRLECAMTSEEADLSGAMDYFLTTLAEDQAGQDRPLGSFAISNTQTGLDENNFGFNSAPYWYWRVKAISSEGISTSEVAAFKIQLPVSVSGVINYPNPFNPNKEKTKIRYKLGREASSVVIRIYDITGALVFELEGDTRAEGATIMEKYNEVEWGGRNGRGDIVRNGIYPFEVVVRSGGKTVSERGKIAVLK